MKSKFLPIMLTGLGIALLGSAANPLVEMMKNVDPLNIQNSVTADDLQKFGYAPQSINEVPMYEDQWEGTDTVTYFAAVQNFQGTDWRNHFEGGRIDTYNVGVARDGDKVTFTNLFNLYDPTNTWSPSFDVPVVGTYDAAAKTITVDCVPDFSNGTVAGNIYGMYMGILTAGVVGEDFKMTPSNTLIFNVEGDFERIYTDQNFGLSQFMMDGSMSYGFYKTYRSFSINIPKEEPQVIKFNDEINFGESFPNIPITKTLTLANIGNKDAEYVVTIDAEGDAYTINEPGGVIPAQSTVTLEFTIQHDTAGTYEGLAMIDCEGAEDTFMVSLNGGVKDYPDYSPIITGGDFTWETNLEFPWEVEQVDGRDVAYSGTHGTGGSSYVTFYFNVPEGKMGVLSYKGTSINGGGWRGCTNGMFVDTLDYPSTRWSAAEEDISNDCIEFAPGDHFVRFQCDQYYYTGDPKDGLYIYDLNLALNDLEADAAEPVKDEVDFGTALIKDGKVDKVGYVEIQNRGKNNLKYISSVSSNEAFEVIADNGPVGTLENLVLTVKMNATIANDYDSRINIKTSAGDYMVHVRAKIYDMPDYSKVVTYGLEHITFEANEDCPFIVDEERGVAYNANTGIPYNEYATAKFTIKFEVPDGEIGYLSWDGYADGTPYDADHSWGWINYAAVDFHHELKQPGSVGGTNILAGADRDASSSASDVWQEELACLPGTHTVSFCYFKQGNGEVYGKDIFEVSNIKLQIGETVADDVMLLTDQVDFEPTYVGPNRFTTGYVTVRNTGVNNLTVNADTNNGVFTYNAPTGFAKFNETMDIPVFFFPKEDGEYEDDLVISTSGGDVTVHCTGATKDQKGIVYPGDLEDGAYGWLVWDYNRDGETWNLGSNLWGDNPNYVHEGHDCLASISMSNDLGRITPDNITCTPAIEIPADGATLKFFVSSFSADDYAEHYSVYIAENVDNIETVIAEEPALSETIDQPTFQPEGPNTYVDGWMERTIDLGKYAGKTVYVVFRHHDCTGQYMLRLDDVFVMEGSGVGSLFSDKAGEVLSQEIYDVNGVRLSEMQNGINIVRTTFVDGTVQTSKVMIRK